MSFSERLFKAWDLQAESDGYVAYKNMSLWEREIVDDFVLRYYSQGGTDVRMCLEYQPLAGALADAIKPDLDALWEKAWTTMRNKSK